MIIESCSVATYSDQPTSASNPEIAIYWKEKDIYDADSTIVDEDKLYDIAEQIAKAFGRIPDYLRGEWTGFLIESSK